MAESTCQVCGNKFTSERSDAKFCSHKCRQKNYRASITQNVSCVTAIDNKVLLEDLNIRFEEMISDLQDSGDVEHIGSYVDNVMIGSMYNTVRKYLQENLPVYCGKEEEPTEEWFEENETECDRVYAVYNEMIKECDLKTKQIIKDKWYNGNNEERKNIFVSNFKRLIAHDAKDFANLVWDACLQ